MLWLVVWLGDRDMIGVNACWLSLIYTMAKLVDLLGRRIPRQDPDKAKGPLRQGPAEAVGSLRCICAQIAQYGLVEEHNLKRI